MTNTEQKVLVKFNVTHEVHITTKEKLNGSLFAFQGKHEKAGEKEVNIHMTLYFDKKYWGQLKREFRGTKAELIQNHVENAANDYMDYVMGRKNDRLAKMKQMSQNDFSYGKTIN